MFPEGILSAEVFFKKGRNVENKQECGRCEMKNKEMDVKTSGQKQVITPADILSV